MKLYYLQYQNQMDEFIQPERHAFREMQIACMKSEFQKISREPMEVFTSDLEGGLTFPEFYYDGYVPLFAERIYQAMRKMNVQNLFTRKIIMTDRIQELSVTYIMGLPLRIDEAKIGNYQIFRTKKFTDNRIYVTEPLKIRLEELTPIGLKINEVLPTDLPA